MVYMYNIVYIYIYLGQYILVNDLLQRPFCWDHCISYLVGYSGFALLELG